MKRIAIIILSLIPVYQVLSEPVVITGDMIKDLIGTRIKDIRVYSSNGQVIPFQIDEIDTNGEYVCDSGKTSNIGAGNGVLDKQDEIVFLWEDLDSNNSELNLAKKKVAKILLYRGNLQRNVFLAVNPGVQYNSKRYIEYNHEQQFLKTPYYYAQFGKNRFHFTKAGVKDFKTGKYTDLTDVLRIEIFLRALWGLLPIHYSEDNIVCIVNRYKAGPVRLIRRGDFHLNLGLGIKGSRAIVNQICYPQVVKVPVTVHVPIRFKAIFSDAFMEMTPVIKSGVKGFTFSIPDAGFNGKIDEKKTDTLINLIPNGRFMSVTDGNKGYGWVLQSDIKDSLFQGSGFVFRIPSKRNGIADCGFRFTMKDLAKGNYQITNWVLFSDNYEHLIESASAITKPLIIDYYGKKLSNHLSAFSKPKK
jgi:hypothetical protein